MKKGKKIYAVVNGEIVEGSFGKPMCLIYLKNSDGSRTRFVSKVYTSKKGAEKGDNPVFFASVKTAKKSWVTLLFDLLVGGAK